MKQLIVAVFAGTLALSSAAVLAADAATTQPSDQPRAETKPERAKEYVKEKAHNAKEKTKRVARKAKNKTKKVIAERKTTDPGQVGESQPAAAPPANR